MPTRLGETTNRIIGTKQVIKHLRQGRVSTLYLAGDVDETVRRMIEEAAGSQQIETVNVHSMQELGRICGIDVGAACAALIN